jgi:hypothetical protein
MGTSEDRLGKWANIAQLVSIGPIMVALFAYFMSLRGTGERRRLAEEAVAAQQQAAQYQAWNVLSAAQGKGGSGGRIQALEYLNSLGVVLYGADLSHAYLGEVKLPKASLGRANLDSAVLEGADLRHANMAAATARGAVFRYANLDSANLDFADLRGAYLSYSSGDAVSFMMTNLQGAQMYNAGILSNADFGGADLRYALLGTPSGIWEQWRHVDNLMLANVYGVRGVPNAFVRWAVDTMGAVAVPSDSAWEVRKQDWSQRGAQIQAACGRLFPESKSLTQCMGTAFASDSAYAVLMKRVGGR